MFTRYRSRLSFQTASLILTLVLIGGCGQSDRGKPQASAEAKPDAPKPPVPPDVPTSTPTIKSVPAQTVSLRRDRLHQSFSEACVWDQAPDGEQRPPDKTITGKDVVKLFEQIAGTNQTGGVWDQIRFVGEKSRPQAIVKTDLGDLQIELYPDQAPNHVRNFVALAKVGYFDGLPFHRSIREESKEKTVSYLEAGCPKGTGEIGLGSLGYWLKAEISESLKHEVGTVGAYHSGDPNGASSKFYCVLNPAPWMDGKYTIFGKIVSGLDVAHTMNKRPIVEEEPFDRPRDPVVIRRVEIRGLDE